MKDWREGVLTALRAGDFATVEAECRGQLQHGGADEAFAWQMVDTDATGGWG